MTPEQRAARIAELEAELSTLISENVAEESEVTSENVSEEAEVAEQIAELQEEQVEVAVEAAEKVADHIMDEIQEIAENHQVDPEVIADAVVEDLGLNEHGHGIGCACPTCAPVVIESLETTPLPEESVAPVDKPDTPEVKPESGHWYSKKLW